MSVQTKIAPEGAKSDTHGEAKTRTRMFLPSSSRPRRYSSPKSVVWCDGSKEEYQAMLKSLVDGGTACG